MKKILFILTLLFLLVGCDQSQSVTTQVQPQTIQSDKVAKVLVDYKIQPTGSSGRCWVDKWEVDGHEYLIFGSGLANPPTVIHNEACPCKELK